MKVVALVFLTVLALGNAAILREIHILTSNCSQCGMTALGELSVKVCGQAAAPNQCCVAANIRNSQSNFVEGKVDIFSGLDLKECYGFNLGSVPSSSQFEITIYHALTDGGKFDYVEAVTSDNRSLRCDFMDFLDGADFENGKNCRLI